MILDRMTDFAFPDPPLPSLHQGMRKTLQIWKSIGLSIVLVGNVVGLCTNASASVNFAKASEYYEAASVGDLGSDIENKVSLARIGNQNGHTMSSIQTFCEVIVVLLIVVAFAVVGAACARRVKTALDGNSVDRAVNAAGRRLRMQIVGTSTVVFLAFLFRSLYQTTFAIVSQLQNAGSPCPDERSPSFYCTASCFNAYTLIWEWMLNTPELELAVVLISSPLALLVSLWGMTTDRMLQQVNALKRNRDEMKNIM